MIDAPIDRDWLTAMPKAENHVHLEGCLDPAVVQRAADRASVEAPGGVPASLDELLHLLDRTCRLMTTPDDLADLVEAKAAAGAAVSIGYTDLIVNPAHWPAWKGRLPEMLDAFDVGFARAATAGHAPIGLSFSIGRHQSADEAHEVAEALTSSSSGNVVGIAVDGNESGPNAGCERFATAIDKARSEGLRVHVHTGESGGPDKIWLSLDHLRPDRIDHGIRSVDDPELVALLVEQQIPLAVCPTSNLTLGFVDDLAEHPLVQLLAAGAAVTINTDDPLLLDTDLVNEYHRCVDTFGWTKAELCQLAAASITASSASEVQKASLMRDLDEHQQR